MTCIGAGRSMLAPMTDVALPAAPEVAGDDAPPRPDFEIVPRRGLPVVGLVLAGLVAAIAANELWPLEFFHVVAGGLWTAFDLFLGFVLGPIMGRLAIPARVELTTRLMPKLLLIMPTLVTCTLASGWQLGRLLGTIDSSYANHSWIVASYIVVGVMAGITGAMQVTTLVIMTKIATG